MKKPFLLSPQKISLSVAFSLDPGSGSSVNKEQKGNISLILSSPSHYHSVRSLMTACYEGELDVSAYAKHIKTLKAPEKREQAMNPKLSVTFLKKYCLIGGRGAKHFMGMALHLFSKYSSFQLLETIQRCTSIYLENNGRTVSVL